MTYTTTLSHTLPIANQVMRDRLGQRLRFDLPLGLSAETNGALDAGLPFPIYCGWNGMARVSAQPFADGLRFRKHLTGECRASECRWGRVGGWVPPAPQPLSNLGTSYKSRRHHAPGFLKTPAAGRAFGPEMPLVTRCSRAPCHCLL